MSGDENTTLLQADQGKKPLWKDDRPYVRWPANICRLTWLILASSYINVLLVFVPLGTIARALSWNPTAIFVLNFLAIVPLASLLTFAVEELSAKLGQTWRGLLNAMFSNAVKLIVNIVALKDKEIRVVQSSMLGSILSNMLLVLGCCFFAAGIRHQESSFNTTLASTLSSLMVVASVSLIVPAALYAALHNSKSGFADNITTLSRATAVILLILYILYLYFQLRSHASLFNKEREEYEDEDEDERHSGRTMSLIASGIALVIIIVLIAVCADSLIGSIDSMAETKHISKTFIGLILLPMLGNATERVTAVIMAYKGKMDLAINVAIGGSMQIALFVAPFLVVLSWTMQDPEPMTLHFQGFETMVFFLCVLVVNYLIQDGKSNYLEGAMCLGTYLIIAIAFRLYPDNAGDIGNAFGC